MYPSGCNVISLMFLELWCGALCARLWRQCLLEEAGRIRDIRTSQWNQTGSILALQLLMAVVYRTVTFSICFVLGFALLCDVCQSFTSWDDCEDNGSVVDCSREDPEFEICFKVHRAVKSNNSETHIYTKGCGFQEQCNGGQCKEYGDWCQVNCCNMDNCNASQTVQVTYITHLFVVVLTALHFV